METILSKENIILKQLSEADALAFFRLYNPGAVSQHEITGNKTPLEFTRHIIVLCNNVYSIRMAAHPNEIIGDCALHDWNEAMQEIEIGGTLLPEYWGKGIMKRSFELLIEQAQQVYNIRKIVAKTESNNLKAIKFAKKMGFKIIEMQNNKVILSKQTE